MPEERGGRPSVQEHVEALVARLDSLIEGPEAAARLVACGTPAVGPLRAFLVEGRPRGVYQPRLWAVQALGGIGADDVLLEYLRAPTRAADPVVRFSEEAVRSAAAKILSTSQLPGVSETLLDVARRERLPGALAAIAERDPDDAVPILIAALEDDFATDAAQAALASLGTSARDALLTTALDSGPGTESALRRRRAALELLRPLDLDPNAWRRLDPLLDEEDSTIVCAASLLGVELTSDPGRMVIRLLHVLPSVGWDWLATAEDVIVRCAKRADGDVRLLLPVPPNGEQRVVMSYRRILDRVGASKERR